MVEEVVGVVAMEEVAMAATMCHQSPVWKWTPMGCCASVESIPS
jgi:hypothetical protein